MKDVVVQPKPKSGPHIASVKIDGHKRRPCRPVQTKHRQEYDKQAGEREQRLVPETIAELASGRQAQELTDDVGCQVPYCQ